MKLIYFPAYGRGEPIRMAFWKAGVEFEDARITHEEFGKMKADGTLPFGQVPVLELDDGTRLGQSGAILSYIGSKYNMKPQDPLACHRGESLSDLVWADLVTKSSAKLIAAHQSEDPAKGFEEVIIEFFVPFLANLEKNLGDTKFVSGDEVTIYDCSICGFFYNLPLNKSVKAADVWKKYFDEKAGPKTKALIQNFTEVFKEYLDKRPDSQY